MDNKVITSGGLIPSTINTPIDVRTRVNTVNDIYNINLPYVGMIVYVIDEDKYYKVKSLKALEITGVTDIIIDDALVDTFEELSIDFFKDAEIAALQKEIAELKSTINELTQVPEIVIANENIESEMAYLNERIKDENVLGLKIDPYVTLGSGTSNKWEDWLDNDWTGNPSWYCRFKFVNNTTKTINNIKTKKIIKINRFLIRISENNLYNIESNTAHVSTENSIVDLNINITPKFYDSSNNLIVMGGNSDDYIDYKEKYKNIYYNSVFNIDIMIYAYMIPSMRLIEIPYSTIYSFRNY